MDPLGNIIEISLTISGEFQSLIQYIILTDCLSLVNAAHLTYQIVT